MKPKLRIVGPENQHDIQKNHIQESIEKLGQAIRQLNERLEKQKAEARKLKLL
jgi:hypothetical protein